MPLTKEFLKQLRDATKAWQEYIIAPCDICGTRPSKNLLIHGQVEALLDEIERLHAEVKKNEAENKHLQQEAYDQESNEMDWDKVWYGEYMTRLAHSDYAPCADIDGVLKIVAEAERRGRVAAWEEAKEIANDLTPFHITREYRDTDAMRDQLVSVFNAKLTELKKV